MRFAVLNTPSIVTFARHDAISPKNAFFVLAFIYNIFLNIVRNSSNLSPGVINKIISRRHKMTLLKVGYFKHINSKKIKIASFPRLCSKCSTPGVIYNNVAALKRLLFAVCCNCAVSFNNKQQLAEFMCVRLFAPSVTFVELSGIQKMRIKPK